MKPAQLTLRSRQARQDACRISTAVEDGDNGDNVAVQIVINGKGKAFGQGTVEATLRLGMDAGAKLESIYVGKQAIEETASHPRLLPLVNSCRQANPPP